MRATWRLLVAMVTVVAIGCGGGDESGTGATSGTAGNGTGEASGTGGSGGSVSNDAPSCSGMGNDCVDNGTPASCCNAKLVAGGTFPMGRCGLPGTGCSDEYSHFGVGEDSPEHDVTVGDFYLDTFEVTVGRFRKFVEQYTSTAPEEGAGAHPLIENSGWRGAWNSKLPADGSSLIGLLKCRPDLQIQTWTDSVGTNEQYPINCVSWYEAFAFCIWDGGRLPTEAEWEYASAGGDYNRLYPWGAEAPDVAPQRANYGATARSPFIDVGSYPAGVGRFGQHDLAGSMYEWVLDWYDDHWYSGDGNTCRNCSNLNTASNRVKRGGSWYSGVYDLRAARRSYDSPSYDSPVYRERYHGVRCARNP